MPLALPDLVAIEAQVLRDRGELESALRKRDREIGARLAEKDDAGRLAAWVRETEAGPRARAAFRAATFLAVGLGLALGASAVLGLFSLNPGRPVNLFHFLFWMVGLQILLLAALLLALARPAPFLAHEAVAWVVERIGKLGLDRLRGRGGRLAPPLRWALVARTQAFGVAFNAAALLTAYALITFSDRQFAWSTTLRNPEGVFFDILHALAAPWRPFLPAASPSLDDLLRSRYFMMEGRYQHPDLGPEAARSWWPFLLMAVAVYGLLPRVLALGFALWRERAALAKVPLRGDAEYSRILERLELDVPEFVADPDRGASEAPTSPGPRAALSSRGGSCVLVAWEGAELDAEAVESRFGWRVARRFRPDEPPAKDVDGPVVLAPPAWEDPTKSYQRVIRAWRRSTGPDRLLLVLLARPERRRIWESVLAGMADPSLRVEALG